MDIFSENTKLKMPWFPLHYFSTGFCLTLGVLIKALVLYVLGGKVLMHCIPICVVVSNELFYSE